jgi:hypothetical protein
MSKGKAIFLFLSSLFAYDFSTAFFLMTASAEYFDFIKSGAATIFTSAYLCEVSYVEVLGDKSNIHVRVTLYWGYLIVLWLLYLMCILYCGCFNLFCNMWVCVCVGFVMCGCVYVWVL